MILLCVNELAGPTGYHKSVVETANALHRGGYPLAVLSFLGSGDGSALAMPRWPLDPGVPAYALQNLPADGGRLLPANVHPEVKGRVYSTAYEFTPNQLAALRQLNAELTAEDTVIFTTPVQALVRMPIVRMPTEWPSFVQALARMPRVRMRRSGPAIPPDAAAG